MKVGRNEPCPCESGLKFKDCCGRSGWRLDDFPDVSAYTELPASASTYYLDTCVWGAIANSEPLSACFVRYFGKPDRIAALSLFALFELSRAPSDLVRRIDGLLRASASGIRVPMNVDDVVRSEIDCYPNRWAMRWCTLSAHAGNSTLGVIARRSRNPIFYMARDKYREWGYEAYAELDQYKSNYPPSNGKFYAEKDADLFAFGNGIGYLSRHFGEFVNELGEELVSLDMDAIASMQSRSLFLFVKHYIHGQGPNDSDYMDFAHASYAPYCSVYVTENNASDVLNHSKRISPLLADTRILRIRDFEAEISQCNGHPS